MLDNNNEKLSTREFTKVLVIYHFQVARGINKPYQIKNLRLFAGRRLEIFQRLNGIRAVKLMFRPRLRMSSYFNRER
jgi:hypothetical protein